MAAPAQKTVAELAEIADRHLNDTWDPDQPLYRWIRAIKHLATEAKSYDKDGSAELALIRLLTIQKLVNQVLPTHPEWNTLPEKNINTINSESAALRPTLEKLKQQIYARTLFHAPSRSSSVASGSTPSLTLRHTVQPASDSMNAPVPPYSSSPAPPLPQPKPKATDKLKRKLGLGKRTSSSSGSASLAVIGEVGRPGSAPPSVRSSGGEEGWESGDEGWTDLGRDRSRSPGLERPRSRAESDGARGLGDGQGWGTRPVVALARGTSYSAQASGWEEPSAPSPVTPHSTHEWRGQSSMPLVPQPRALDQEVDQPGIVYARAGGPAWDALPVRATYSPSAPTSSTHTSTYHSSVPPSRASTSSSATSYQPQALSLPNSYDDTPYAQFAGMSIQRAPSRLTTTHQRQQGFYPSLRRQGRAAGRDDYGNQSLPQQLPEELSVGSDPLAYASSYPQHPSSSASTTAYSGATAPLTSHAYQHPTSRHAGIPPQQPIYPQQPQKPMPQSTNSYPVSTSPTKPFRPLPVPPLERPKPPPTPNSFARAHPDSRQPLPRVPTRPPDSRGSSQLHSAPPVVIGPARLARTGSVSAMPFPPPDRGDRAALALTEDGLPLRNVVIPRGLTNEFLKRAHPNTRKGIETCGLLMAKLVRNEFVITHLLIPKQEGTVDTCHTTDEVEQFMFQDEHDLLTVGWIHTHPEFSCFMSSLDLHTHSSYQSMLAEAIAIVCAPHEDPPVGVFRLTSPVGIDCIQGCREPGAFHPHPNLPIYTDSDPRFGHARMRDVPFETVDLRKKSRW